MPSMSRKHARSPNGTAPPAAKHSKTTKRRSNRKHTSDSGDNSDTLSGSGSEPDHDKLGVDPQDCKIAGRAIARCCDMFCNVNTSINVVLYAKQEDATQKGELSDSEDEETTLQRQQFLSKMSDETIVRHKRAYTLLVRLVPGIKSLVDNPSNSSKLKAAIKSVNGIISETRASDAARFKDKALSYVVRNPAVDQLSPPIPPGSSRSSMGLNHAVLAGLLCPIEAVAAFHEEPEATRKKLESGKIDMSSSDFPAFLWEDNGRQFDTENMLKGLFKGHFLERVTRHIFTSPSTGLGGDSLGTRPSNSDLHHMDKAEAAQIAYAAVQARWSISSKTRWSEKDGNFNYREFYYSIIDIIDNCEDASWKDMILKHYNLMLFKNEDGRKINFTEKTSDDNGPAKPAGFLGRLRAQAAAGVASRVTPDPSKESGPLPPISAPPKTPPQTTPHVIQPESPLGFSTAGPPIQSYFSPIRQPTIQPSPHTRVVATPRRTDTPPSDLTDLGEMNDDGPGPSKAKSMSAQAEKKGKKKASLIMLDSDGEAASSSRPQRKSTRKKGRK